jgi:hypothetical protein
MLAMVVNDNAGDLTPRGALGFYASPLAPTEEPPPPKKKGRLLRRPSGWLSKNQRCQLMLRSSSPAIRCR